MKKLIFALILFTSCVQSAKKEVIENKLALEHMVRVPTNLSLETPTLILLHGFGSNEKDLFDLEQYILPNWLVISVRAPMTISEGKYKWYEIDGTSENIVQAEESRVALLTFIDGVVNKYKVSKEKLVVGGFSQGGILSYSIGLTSPDQLNGIACFSGRILDYIKKDKISSDPNLKFLNVYVSHGSNDKIIEVREAHEALNFMEGLGINPISTIDESAHTLSSEHFNNFGNWLVSYGAN